MVEFRLLYLEHQKKYCLTMNQYGVIDEHKTFEGFIIVSDNLEKNIF